MFFIIQLEEGSRAENLQAHRCRARLDHLDSADAENLSEWNNVRLKRILVDYMSRMSYYDSAVKLAESSNIQVIYMLASFHIDMTMLDLTWRNNTNTTYTMSQNLFILLMYQIYIN